MKRFLFLILTALLLAGPTLSLAAPHVTSDAQSPTITRRVSTLADLKLITGKTAIQSVGLQGRLTEGDGGEGDFRWLAGDQSANPGVVADTLEGIYAKPTTPGNGSTGVWVRQNADVADVRWFGALKGASDSSTAFQAAIDMELPVYAPGGPYVAAGLIPTSTSDIIMFGDGSTETTINAPAGHTGYMVNTTRRYDIRGIAFVGNATPLDGSYCIGADGAGESATRPILNDVRMFNFDQCIRFGFEFEHPLGLDYTLVYAQNFLTAGFNFAGTSGAASSGESAWSFTDCIATNPTITPVEFAPVVQNNVPSTSQDTIDWTDDGASDFGFLIIRSADGLTDWHVPPNWTSGNFTSTTFIADKTISETWNYKVLRMTVGINIRRAKAINFGAVQTEYTGIGLRLQDVRAVHIGSHYYEVRDDDNIGNFAAIYCTQADSVGIDASWAEEVGYTVFVSGNSKVSLNSARSSAGWWSVIGNTGATDQVIEYGNIEKGSTPLIYRSPAGAAQDFNYIGTEYTSSDHIRKLSHTTKVGYEVQHRGATKGGLFGDITGSWAELNKLDLTFNDKSLTPVVTNGIGTTALVDGVATDILTIATPNNNSSGSARFHYLVENKSAGVVRSMESGWLDISAINVSSTTPIATASSFATSQVVQAGTLTVAFSTSVSAGAATIECTATQSLGTPSLVIKLTPLSLIGNIDTMVQQ